jgi:hypothetical protein
VEDSGLTSINLLVDHGGNGALVHGRNRLGLERLAILTRVEHAR